MAKANADARALEDKCEALRLQLVAVREETAAATEAMQSSHAAKLHELQVLLLMAALTRQCVCVCVCVCVCMCVYGCMRCV